MNVKKILLIILIACMAVTVWVSSSGLLFSQLTTGRGRLSGIVTVEGTGEPIEGVIIKLFSIRANAFHTPDSKTGADGRWRANYIRGGLWNLDFSKNGYETKKISFTVNTKPGTSNPPIELQLRKLEGPALEQTIMDEIKLAAALITEKKYDQALADLQAILEKYKDQPGVEIAYLHIGNCYSNKGEYQRAIEYFLKSLEKFPNNKEIILSVGNAYGNLNDFDNAMKWFNKLQIDDIGNIDTLYNIGVIYYNKGDFEGALKFFKKSTEINNEFADGFYQLGMTYTALDKQKEAVEALKKFMELDPKSPNYETAKAVVEAFGQ